MSKLPIVDAKSFEKLLLSLGFVAIRQKGSHVFYRHPDGRYTTLPHHKGTDLTRPLISQIIKQINISAEEYIQLLKSL
jgi:predicted RNA binding protein YcfA (HicA-like mRNA interferase family)